MIKISHFNSRNKMTHRHYKESVYKQGTQVVHKYDNEKATVIDNGPLQLMTTKYQNLHNVYEFEDELQYNNDMPTVVVQFNNEDEYYLYPEDEVEKFGKKELVYLKDILKSLNESQSDLDGLKYLELPIIKTAQTNLKTTIRNVKDAISLLES